MKTKGFSIGIIFLVLMVCTTCTKDEALLTPDGELSALKAAPVENAPISVAAIDALILKIENYVASGDLEPGIANSLISKLENAKKSLEKGNEKAAMNQVQAVLSQLESLVGNGIIDPDVGEEIIFDTEVIAGENPTFIDTRDNREYKTVLIGEQIWMAENLAYLPSISSGLIGSAVDPHYYVYGYWGYDLTSAKERIEYDTYGALYNWPAAVDACPTGWHLPSDGEWTELSDFLGGESIAGDKMKELGIIYWSGNSTNSSGFSALPAGIRGHLGGFGNGYTWIWSSTQDGTADAWLRELLTDFPNLYRFSAQKESGFSVRCIKD